MQAFESVDALEFIGTGDFNNDGHADVVLASTGSRGLTLLHGDGRGNFGRTEAINLPGQVTTMATGDINRRDGLMDILVGITGTDGPKLLVFEAPEGAEKAKPEVFDLPPFASSRLGSVVHDLL